MPKQQDPVWDRIRTETEIHAQEEPVLASFLHSTILNHDSLECALSFHLASQLDSPTVTSLLLREVMLHAMRADPAIAAAAREDLLAVVDRDSASHELYIPFLYYKGYHSLQSHRIGHWLWNNERRSMALFFQNRVSVKFGVDIHPAARMGRGIMLDHATGLVIGETAVVGNNVSILQSVTLGGTGKEDGDRHPKIGDGVLISAGAKILGNIRVGEGAKVGAGSVVLEDVPPHTTVAGVPARVVGRPTSESPALDMDHDFCCDGNDVSAAS
ncbi:serine O-acetyltransferase [Pseudohalioglobus lutimaris]|uniref:Serine acetyltransferase n=1 Tax=Pseudohalioglobus lutimaris TaxID=1737061 RepID=A0A2N5X3P9_9GAMM|nr:serine O-acetyltransferase [Pseudohalioglobus lutimaris]PLW69118.1 serine O-acetyltransferase [Pseudohalioglobus lutimaris]